MNALIEADRVVLLQGAPEVVVTPSESGRGQKIARCPRCRIALWSNYAGAGDAVRFVRVGTLDEPDRLPPDIHIFTASKQPWVQLPPGARAVPEYYDREKFWPAESLARRRVEPEDLEHVVRRRERRRADPEERVRALAERGRVLNPSSVGWFPRSGCRLSSPERWSRRAVVPGAGLSDGNAPYVGQSDRPGVV